MILCSKRFMAAMLAFIITATTLSALPITVAADSSERVADLKYVTNVMLDDDFESYEEGTEIPETGNIYLPGNNKQWGSNAAVVAVEEITGNKVARLYSETAATLNMYKVAYNGTEKAEQNMYIKARVKPMNGTSQIIIDQYIAPRQSVVPVLIQNGALKCFGTTVGSVQMDKWTDIEILVDFNNNRSCVYINGTLVSEKENLLNEGVEMTFPVIYFRSAVSAGASAYWDDIYIREANRFDKDTWQEKGNNLETLEGVHPRIFATADDFENMKRMASGELSEEYDALIKRADKIIPDEPPEYHMGTNKEQLWLRDVATNIMILSLAYKISGDTKYKDEAKIWVDAGIGYPTWGMENCKNCDLAAGAMFVSVACYYDWLFHELTDEEKAAIVADFAVRGVDMNNGSWYDSNYLQNHLWIARGGLYVAAAAIYDVHAPAVKWFNTADQSYKSIFKYLGAETSDGASHEGFGYYTYGLTSMIYYLDIADKFMNIDYSNHAYLKNAYRYMSNMVVPGSYNKGDVMIFSYGDQTKFASLSFLVELAYIASYTNSPESQWWVNHWREIVNDYNGNAGLTDLFLWYDESVGEKSFEEQGRQNDELLDHLKLFFSRSGWDDNATVVAYRCGPLFGEDAAAKPPKYDLGHGHNHGDLNSMNIYTRGDNLFADMEYGNKETSAHSTLMVNGLGQEINAASITRLADVIKIDSQDKYSYSVGDATGMYNADTTGLTKFHRHFIYLKPDILILVDDVETKESETPIPLELRFFPASSEFVAETDGSVTFKLPNTTMNIHPADMQEGVVSACGTITKGITSGLGLTVTTDNQKLVQPTIISWNDKDKAPVKVDVIRKKDSKIFEFYTNRDRIVLDVENMTVTHEIIKTGDTAIKLDGALIEGDYLATLGSDYRFYMEADELAKVLGLEYEIKGNTATLSNSLGAKTVMTVGSDIITMNDKQMTIDGKPYIVGENIMVPVRYAAQGFGIGVDYNEADKVLAFRSNADFSGAELKSISVNGVAVAIEEGTYDYSVSTFGYDTQISALAKDSSTKIDIESNGMDNISVIRTTSADGTNSKTYNLAVNARRGIGNVGIYGMSYSESDGNVGENAFDGRLDSRWAANGVGQWIFMDLGKKVKLDHILVSYAYGTQRKEYFDIQVSDDGESWTTIGKFNSSGTTIEPEKYPLDGVETRYVRFWSRGQGQGGWTSVGEIGLVKAE